VLVTPSALEKSNLASYSFSLDLTREQLEESTEPLFSKPASPNNEMDLLAN
jgi:hypothetical protein